MENVNARIVTNIFWKFFERIGSQIVTLFVSIILARILSPSDYGLIALVSIFITISNSLVTYGFATALVQKKNADKLDFSTILYFNIFISIVLYLLLFFTSKNISVYFGQNELSLIIKVLGIQIIFSAINSVQQAYVSRYFLFRKSFISSLFSSTFSAIIGIGLAYRNFGVWALVYQNLSSIILNTLLLALFIKWVPLLRFSFIRLRHMFRYGSNLLFVSIFTTLYSEVKNLIVGKTYSAETLAYFNRGDSYPQLIMNNVNYSISAVMFPEFSNYQDNLIELKKLVRKSISISTFIVFPIMIGFAIVAKPLVLIVLTDKWLPSVPFIWIACITYSTWPIQSYLQNAIKATGKSNYYLFVEIFRRAVSFVFILFFINKGIILLALSIAVGEIFSTLILAIFSNKIIHYNIKELFEDITFSLLISFFMGLIIILPNFFINNIYVLLFVQVLLGILIYTSLSSIFNKINFQYIYKLLKGISQRS